MESIQDIKRFVLAGHAIFTIRSKKSGNRFTYKITKKEESKRPFFFVCVLGGPDNVSHYSYIGIISNGVFKTTVKSKHLPNVIRAFDWFLRKVENDNCMRQMDIFHEGYCGRCGRRLTIPESIKAGFGPYCRGEV